MRIFLKLRIYFIHLVIKHCNFENSKILLYTILILKNVYILGVLYVYDDGNRHSFVCVWAGRKLFFEVEKVSVALLFLLQEKGRLRKVPLGEPPRRIWATFVGVWVHRLIFLVFGYVHLDHICD